MKKSMLATLAAFALLGSLAAQAKDAPAPLPADAPAGSTVLCKDGSYQSPDKKAGACKGHQGIKTWYGSATAPAPAKAAPPAAPPAAPAATPSAAAPAGPKPAVPAPAKTAAPGGGPGLVWANDSTKVYHCQGDRFYGTTKHGEYMREADAKAKGMKPSHSKACS